jgi:hypothetical protein
MEPRPGIRNVAGDTLPEALIPLQPVKRKSMGVSPTSRRRFLFDRTAVTIGGFGVFATY